MRLRCGQKMMICDVASYWRSANPRHSEDNQIENSSNCHTTRTKMGHKQMGNKLDCVDKKMGSFCYFSSDFLPVILLRVHLQEDCHFLLKSMWCSDSNAPHAEAAAAAD